MYDLVIVGGGFWGIATAVMAKSKGLSAIVLDDLNPKSASRNAAGIVCRHWYRQGTIKGMTPADWTLKDVEDGIKFLAEECSLNQTGETFSSYTYAKGDAKSRSDCLLVPSPKSLLEKYPVVEGVVRRVYAYPDSVKVVASGKVYDCHHVLIAAGAWTDSILSASGLPTVGVRGLRGRAVIAEPRTPCVVHHTFMSRPYTHWTLRPWVKSTVRLGDSVEKTLDGGDGPLNVLRKNLETMSPGARVVEVLDGIRPVCKEFTVKVVAPRVVVATGGHRVGLALAGAVAGKVLNLIGA